MKHTAIVILNWNGTELLRRFVPGVLRSARGLAEVWVIDNGSTDDSVEVLKSEFPEVQLIQLDKNLGFAAGYNQGLEHINAELFVLLNSDVEVPDDWLRPVIDMFEKNPEMAVCQPKILDWKQKSRFEHAGAAGGYIDKDGFMFCAGRIFDSFEEDSGQYDTDREVFWASGACLFVRADLYREVGGLDEDFYAHMEEIDLCYRLKNKGFAVYCCGKSRVWHMGGASLHMQHPFKVYLNFRNSLYLITKNQHHGFLPFVLFRRMLLDGIAATRFLTEGKPRFFWAVFRAHIRFYLNMGKMLSKRKQLKPNRPNMAGMYGGSIVIDFFLRKKKTFKELDSNMFVANSPHQNP